MRATKRDYWEIVRVIRRLEKGVTRRLMWGIALSKVLKNSNPRFNEKAFIDACAAEDDPNNVIEFAKRNFEK